MTRNKPNFTAWFVLQGTLATRHLLDPGSADTPEPINEILARSASKTRLISRMVASLPYHWQYRLGEFVTNPGRLRHFYLRKQTIERLAREFLETHNAAQVIILGAGLDTLGYRLASDYTQATIVEIDTGASQAFKRSALAQSFINIPGNIELIDGDLRNPLTGILAHSGFYRPSVKTLWIAEGLFMFIPKDDVARIFQQMKEASAAGSSCIFTTLPYMEQGSKLARLIQMAYLKKEDSAFKWAIPTQDVPAFMQALHYTLVDSISYWSLHSDYQTTHRTVGEDIHVVKAS